MFPSATPEVPGVHQELMPSRQASVTWYGGATRQVGGVHCSCTSGDYMHAHGHPRQSEALPAVVGSQVSPYWNARCRR